MMKKNPVVFFSISEYDNLGIGYIASVLEEAGFKTVILDFRDDETELLKTVRNLEPLVIGFSIIFLTYIKQFTALVKDLRENGINCHFTAGGHYASLRPAELFMTIPQLDSIIMFEGEFPMLELACCLRDGNDWKNIKSLSFKKNGDLVCNTLRIPEKDIDIFPLPKRSEIREYAFGKKFSVIIAGRGCSHNCSFCNTREFYRRSGGPLKRIRKPERVAEEMKILYNEKDCSVFIFHDDDFPVRSIGRNVWINEFCCHLGEKRLNDKILWKINCRSDDIEEVRLRMMKENGLFLVFLGLEDGTDSGLKGLNKQLGVSDNIRAIKVLKKLQIGFDFGFMLFQPSTTFSSLNENLDFLKEVCGDGYTPVSFLRLLPLYETRIEKELEKAGRLIHSGGVPDYEFPEETMNRYYSFTADSFAEWQRSANGVENISKWARNYCLIYKRYFVDNPDGELFCIKATEVIRDSNLFILNTMKELATVFSSGSYDENLLESYRQRIESGNEFFKNEIINTMAHLVSFVEDYNTV